MAVIGYSSRGGGPGGVLPASTGVGQLLIGDGTGTWAGNPNLPAIVPGSAGQVPFWDGTNRYRYSAAPVAHGQILQWDIVAGVWVPVGAPSADGQVLVWDVGTGQWVARTVQTYSLQFSATQIPASAISYLFPGGNGALAGTTQSNGQDVVTRAGFIRRLTVMHQVASTAVVLTYTAQIEGANSLLTTSQNGNVADEVQDAVNVAAVANLDRVGIRIDNPGPTLTTPRVIARIEAFAFV